jgi:hypothetical protein
MANLTGSIDAHEQRSCWLTGAGLGALVWAAGVAILWPGEDTEARSLAGVELLLSPLALLPLAVALIPPATLTRGWRLAAWVQLPTASLLVVAFAVAPGPLAALLSLPWLTFTGLIGLLGLANLSDRTNWKPAGFAISAGLMYVAVGGAWTLASRLGRGFLGFEEPLVLLTGAHFHYAGLLLPILVGLATRAAPGRVADITCILVIVAVPAVALGITLAGQDCYLPDLSAALLMSVAGILAGFLQLRLAHRANSALPRGLLALSGVSLIAGMILAAAYAVGNYAERTGDSFGSWLTIPLMIRYHAAINIFGFALPGLLAWLVSADSNFEPERH